MGESILKERNPVYDESKNPPLNSYTCESEPEHNRIFVRPRLVLFWSGEATPGVSGPVIIRVRTAYSNAAT